MNGVSICIPCYNQVKYLRKTIESVLEQDYPNYEIMVSDDSSTEEVKNLVSDFNIVSGNKIRYYRNIPGLGSPQNWNHCISLSSFDWIKFMHHDDWFTSNSALSQFMSKATESVPFVFSSAVSYNVNDEQKKSHIPPTSFLNKLKKNPAELFLHNLLGPPSSVLFNRKSSVLFDVRMKWLVDVDFYIRTLNVTERNFIFIEDTLITSVNHASHNVTAFSNNAETELYEYYLLYKKLKDNLCVNKLCVDRMAQLNKKYKIISYNQLKPYLRDLKFTETEFIEIKESVSLVKLFSKIKSKFKND